MTANPKNDVLVSRLKAAALDERLGTGALYDEAADALQQAITLLRHLVSDDYNLIHYRKLTREWLRRRIYKETLV